MRPTTKIRINTIGNANKKKNYMQKNSNITLWYMSIAQKKDEANV